MSGFPEFSGDDAFSLTTSRPVTPQVVDAYGRQTVYGTLDNADPSGNFPLDSRIVEFIEYGVLNGSFARGPKDQNHDITDINPIDDWSGPVQVSGGAITCQWVTDATYPSGHALRFTLNPGAASDEAYVEQIVPIGGTFSQAISHSSRFSGYCVTTTSTSVTVFMDLQYLDASGATVGTGTNAQSMIASATKEYQAQIASLVATPAARFLRIRLRMQRASAAASDSATFDFTDVRVEPARVGVLIADKTDPITYTPGILQQDNGNLELRTTGATSIVLVSNGTPVVTVAATGISLGSLALNTVGSIVLTGLMDISGASAGQIAFPATQNASANVNTLDDYEEGTFTPALSYATVGTSSWATTSALGFYTKIGREVIIRGLYNGVPTNGTGAGNLQLTGLPFTVQNTAGSAGAITVAMQGWTKASYTQVTGTPTINSTVMLFRANGSGQANANLAVGDIPTGGTVIVQFGGSYFV